MRLCVRLKSAAPEEADRAFQRFATWGDTCIPGEAEDEMLYFLHAASFLEIERWCEAAVERGLLSDFAVQQEITAFPELMSQEPDEATARTRLLKAYQAAITRITTMSADTPDVIAAQARKIVLLEQQLKEAGYTPVYHDSGWELEKC